MLNDNIIQQGVHVNNILVKFVRGRRNHKVGCVVATGAGKVGWSLAMKTDRKTGLNRTEAVDLALSRTENPGVVPKSVKIEYDAMIERSKRYFK